MEGMARRVLINAGLTGTSGVPLHRILFCSTTVGKTAIVRQINPHLHCDSESETVIALSKFNYKILQVVDDKGPAASNVLRSDSLKSFFDV
jgi:hypothetical protein